MLFFVLVLVVAFSLLLLSITFEARQDESGAVISTMIIMAPLMACISIIAAAYHIADAIN